jgi:DNA polymerase I-like protein with 3'-5' exonuclease and polymerase domains
MASISLPEAPPPFHCDICARAEYATKAGPGCVACPAFKGAHYFPQPDGSEYADVLVVGDAPIAPRLAVVGGKTIPDNALFHQPFRDDGARVLKNAIKEVQKQHPEFAALDFRYVYAVKCAVDAPSKAVITACRTPLKSEVARLAAARNADAPERSLTVIACGVPALHALGIPVRSEKEAIGRVYDNVKFGDAYLTVVFTRSLKALAVAVGKYSSVLADVERAMRIATHAEIRSLTRAEIEKDYIYPKTLSEVKDVLQHAFEYTREGVEHLDWKVAFDTETNTLHPHWKGTKLVAVSLAWDDGKAATIPLWHKETPYDPAAAYEHVLWFLRSGKPLVWFNAKYDFKVFWRLGFPLGDVGKIAWDVFCAEHVLEEDKKGQYNLKYLTKQELPFLSGYEDRLHDELVKADSANFSDVQVSSTRAVKLPRTIASALERAVAAGLIKDVQFRPETAKKTLERLKQLPLGDEAGLLKLREQVSDLSLLLTAKANGEFTGKAEREAAKDRKRKGGFEDVPLAELCFYAAVDSDAARRLAVKQSARMYEEDDKFERWRRQVHEEIVSGPPNSELSKYRVDILCEHPAPLHRLVKQDYLPRQTQLAKIEYQGINIDQDYRAWGEKALDNTISSTTDKIFELCGEQFPLGSPKKLAGYLFLGGVGYKHPDPELAEQMARENPETIRYVGGRIMYRSQHYTVKGQMQTGEAVLKSLVTRYKCPLANLLMSLKKADKAKNSFFKNIGILSNMFDDGKIHPGYNITGTSTGRLSSSSGVDGVGFNNQNIIKGMIGALRDMRGNLVLDAKGQPVFEGVKCKKLFIPDDDSFCFGNADAKGAEVSIFAGYAKDEALINALLGGMDAHCFFSAECLNPNLVAAGLHGEERRIALANAAIDDDHAWTYDDFMSGKDCEFGQKAPDGTVITVCRHNDHKYCKRLKSLRDNIKRLVFGLLYGAGVKKIADIAGINLELAQQIKKLLFTKFPTLEAFINQTIWEMRTFGIVETYHGRRRRFSLGKYAPNALRAKAERQAVNFKIQATNSDIVMMVLCWVADVIERDLKGRLLLTVHDSIGFQVPKKYAHQIPEIFKKYGTERVARECPWLPVPYRWDVELGPSYGEVMGAEKYLAGLPAPLPLPELDGCIEEEIFDDLRDPDEHELAPSTKPPRRAPKLG